MTRNARHGGTVHIQFILHNQIGPSLYAVDLSMLGPTCSRGGLLDFSFDYWSFFSISGFSVMSYHMIVFIRNEL